MSYYEKIKIDSNKRVFFVGDLHGHYDLYKKGCKELEITNNDYVICVGDLSDRMHKNFACVAEFTHKPNRKSVQGNHCQMLIDGITDTSWRYNWIVNGGQTVVDEVGEEGVICLAEMLKQNPLVLDVEYGNLRLGVAHAGLPYINDNIFDWNKIEDFLNNWKFRESILWDRQVIGDIQWDLNLGIKPDIQKVENVDYVFSGHTVISKPLVCDNRVYIDTGSFCYDKLTFAYFEDEELKFYTTGDYNV